MSKSTSSSVFRRVDVDQFDEERFVDDDTVDAGDQGPNESEVQSLITTGKNVDALLLVLNSAPAGSKNVAVKDKAAALVMDVLMSIKVGDIDQAVKALDSRNIDTLMKYIYRGFEMPTESGSATLLTWHQKVFATGGLGSIMRVMTDRKRV